MSAYTAQDFLGTRWAIMAEIDESEVLAPLYKMRDFMLISVVAIAIVIAAIGYFLAMALSRPIVTMTEAMTRLASNDLDIEISFANRRDEIGEMVNALEVFRENAVKRKQAEARLRKSEKRLKRLAATDPLTGARNRRSFLDECE